MPEFIGPNRPPNPVIPAHRLAKTPIRPRELEFEGCLPYNQRTMSDAIQPKVAKWPFFAGDVLLLGVAVLVFNRAATPMGFGEMAVVVAPVALGAVLSILPFLLDNKGLVRLTEAADLATVMSQFSKIEQVAEEIRGATGQWQGVNGEAARAAAAAKGVTDKMAEEARAFGEFMQRANDSEKATLRLEVEKMRRAEGESLHVLVRILDHVFALHQAGLRSGQASLVEQLSHFQNACCEAARWLGLAPFIANAGEKFDAQRHQLAEGSGAPPPDAVVGQTLATGYTFQGRLLRPALVKVRANTALEAAPSLPPAAPAAQSAPTPAPN